jgi:hypothetical protein
MAQTNTPGLLRLLAAVAALLIATSVTSPRAAADFDECNDPSCTPGIRPAVTLGATCEDPAYFVFSVTSWGRLVFCGSPRRYEPRYFRSPPMYGVKLEDALCTGMENGVAQAPDGLFLTCVASAGTARWVRGDV